MTLGFLEILVLCPGEPARVILIRRTEASETHLSPAIQNLTQPNCARCPARP